VSRRRSRSEQFAIVPEVVLDARVPDGAKVLYAVLRRYSNSEGECWPSVATLAARLGVSERTVKRHREALVRAGLLVVEPRFDDYGQRSNLYCFPSLVADDAGDDAGDEGGTNPGTILTPGDTDDLPPRDRSVPHNESHSERDLVENVTTGSSASDESPSEEAARLLASQAEAALLSRGVKREVARARALARLPEARRLLRVYPGAPTPMLVGALLGEDSRYLNLYRNREAARGSLRVVEEVDDDA
jgi:DNA-binding transcriptional ArsR family regulator